MFEKLKTCLQVLTFPLFCNFFFFVHLNFILVYITFPSRILFDLDFNDIFFRIKHKITTEKQT